MASKTHNFNPDLYRYLQNVSLREPELLKELRKQTDELPEARMQTSPEQAQFIYLLVRLIKANQIIEIGVFTGYSTLYMALALPEKGRIIGCDVSEEWTMIGRKFWKRAGVEDKIDLILGPAHQTLQGFIEKGRSDEFDLAYIDADKVNYDVYYESCLELVRPGGLILIDNTLWEGRVIEPDMVDPDTNAIHALNLKLLEDQRIDLSLLPIGDGVTLARKK